MNYGVQKIIAINSGKYILAEVDVSRPVHLAADNNRGKSTLVNTLQFLYIDDFAKMRFGKRSLEDTKRHYFGSDRSYLIFECQTPSGLQCMLVRGLGALTGGRFERYLYDRVFLRDDYVDEEGQIRDFQTVRGRLADRQLAQVKNSELWRVLSAKAPVGEGKSQPRLGILPIRKREEYDAFRDVFAKLLSLSVADAKTLKHLIIESHARDLAERRIDVALDYRDDFDRVERSERELGFIQAASKEILRGRAVREEVAQLSKEFGRSGPEASKEARRAFELIGLEEHWLNDQQEQLAGERLTLEGEKETSDRLIGMLKAHLSQIEQKIAELDQKHAKWGQYSPEFVAGMRGAECEKTAALVELSASLDHAAKFDVHAVTRRAHELEGRIALDKAALTEWERTAAAELIRAGVTESELQSAFRVARPELLKLVVGKTLTIKNLEMLSERVRQIATRVKNDVYSDDAAIVDLASVSPPEPSIWRDRKELQKQLDVDLEDLRRRRTQLEIANNLKDAKRRLERLQEECDELRRDLNDYDSYSNEWAKRGDYKLQQREVEQQIKSTERQASSLRTKLSKNAHSKSALDGEMRELESLRRSLSSVSLPFHEHLRAILPGVAFDATVVLGRPPNALRPHIQEVIATLELLNDHAKRIEQLRQEILELQTIIHHRSAELRATVCYFGEPEAEWARLIENYESLPEREAANEKNWDALLKTLGARINGVVTAMRNIKVAVEGINRGLKNYQVSNLRAVELSAEVVNDIYSALEALTGSDGLFEDREAVAAAKRRLRRMIDTQQVIELHSLFEITIRTQLPDGTWQVPGSLDEVGSTGTGMTTKAMIFIQLVRAIAGDNRYRLHFYIDGLGELDDNNLSATAEMAISKGVIPITADPRLHFEPLAHPEVTIYSLGQDGQGRFYIDSFRTYRAHRLTEPRSPVKAADE